MENSKKKFKVNPYMVGGVVAIGGTLWLLSEPSATEKASGLDGLGSLRSRLLRIKHRLTPKSKVIQKLVRMSPLNAPPSLLSGVENPADYYGDLYNRR